MNPLIAHTPHPIPPCGISKVFNQHLFLNLILVLKWSTCLMGSPTNPPTINVVQFIIDQNSLPDPP